LEDLPGTSQCFSIFLKYGAEDLTRFGPILFLQGICCEDGPHQISFHKFNEQDWWVVEWTFTSSLGKLDN
jgi:hypothetical protein